MYEGCEEGKEMGEKGTEAAEGREGRGREEKRDVGITGRRKQSGKERTLRR